MLTHSRIDLTLVALLTIGILGYFCYAIFHKKNAAQNYGTVIILNGPSGSGKSSLQKEFQYCMMPHLWIKLGIDTLFDKPMPDITMENLSFWQSNNPIRWVENSQDATGNAVVTLYTGAEGEAVAYGMNAAIAAYARKGCNVIVDYIAYKKEWLKDLEKQLDGVHVVWVKITIPLETLEQREVARATSPKGHGRSHYDTVYADKKYDLVIDTSVISATEGARILEEYIKKSH